MEHTFDVETVMCQIREEIAAKKMNQEKLFYKTAYYDKAIDFFRKQEEIIIFGVGRYGEILYHELEEQGILTVQCFCDNNQKLIGTKYRNHEILCPADAVDRYPKGCFAITPLQYENEILQQLVELGVPVNQIRIFNIAVSGLE